MDLDFVPQNVSTSRLTYRLYLVNICANGNNNICKEHKYYKIFGNIAHFAINDPDSSKLSKIFELTVYIFDKMAYIKNKYYMTVILFK